MEVNMTKVIFVTSGIDQFVVDAADGESVMKAAVANLVPGIVADCGGELSCAPWPVFVDEAWADRVGTPSEDELGMLDAAAAEPSEHSRLSCQISCTPELDGLVVHVPEEQ